MKRTNTKSFNKYEYNSIRKLCKLYQVDYRTMLNWLYPMRKYVVTPFELNNSRRLAEWEINNVFIYLGQPFATKDEIHLKGFDFYKYNTRSSLAKLYGVNRKTFSKWLEPYAEEFYENFWERRKFCPQEQRRIMEKIGFPDPKRIKQLNSEIKSAKIEKNSSETDKKNKKSEKNPSNSKKTSRKWNNFLKRIGLMGSSIMNMLV